MDILFANDELEQQCVDQAVARRKIGASAAKHLSRRLTQLQAAPRLSDFTFGKPHPLKGDLAGCIGIWLDGGFRLVVRPAQEPPPLLADGGLDRARVTSLVIVFIGDYHD